MATFQQKFCKFFSESLYHENSGAEDINICELLEMESWQCIALGWWGACIELRGTCLKRMLAISAISYYLNYGKQIGLMLIVNSRCWDQGV